MDLSLPPLASRSTGKLGEPNALVFVVGLHRSGTTLLARCLGKHSSFSGFSETGAPMDEGQYLQTVMRGRDGGVLDAVGSVGLKPKMRLTEKSALATQENADKLWREWAPHWNLDKRFLVEKSPGNITKVRILQYYFPSARFVIITRNPIEQVMAIRKWAGNRTYAQHFLNWTAAHQFLYRDMRYLEFRYVVRYEELVSSPDRIMADLFGFLGEEMEVATAAAVSPKNGKYSEMWDELMRDNLFRLQMRTLTPFIQPTFNRWGYYLKV